MQAPGTGRGPRPDSLVGDGRHVIEELPGDALQDGVPEAGVVQYLPLLPVDHHHLDAVFEAGVLLPVHLQMTGNTECDVEVGRGSLRLSCPPGSHVGSEGRGCQCSCSKHKTHFSQFLQLCVVAEGHVCVCACSVAQSCLTLHDHIACSPPGSSVHGISQARVGILEWVVISSSRGSSQPRDQTLVSCFASRRFTT